MSDPIATVETVRKWFQDGAGNTSSMRIMAMMSTVTGCVAVLAGITLVALGIEGGVTIAATGAGMSGLGEVAKSWQARNGS